MAPIFSLKVLLLHAVSEANITNEKKSMDRLSFKFIAKRKKGLARREKWEDIISRSNQLELGEVLGVNQADRAMPAVHDDQVVNAIGLE